MTRLTVCLLALLFVAVPSQMTAEEEPAFVKYFFTPEVIMNNGGAIDLTKEQRAAILKEVQLVQKVGSEVQFSMFERAERLNQLSQAATVDEAGMLEAAREIFAAEALIKESHLSLLVRLRNTLTPEQREKLTAIRDGE